MNSFETSGERTVLQPETVVTGRDAAVRAAWVQPLVSRMSAGSAEGSTNSIDDSLAGFS